MGFALTNLVTVALWQDFRAVVGAEPVSVETALYSPFLTNVGGILAAITLLIGTISTPIICQKIFAQGYAFTGETGNPGALGRAATDTLYRANTVGHMLAASSPATTAMAAHANAMPSPLPVQTTPGL